MKRFAAVLTLLFSAGLMQAQAPVAIKPAPHADPAAKPAAPATAATTPGKAAPGKPEVKKEELPKIPGTVINRANGTFLSLEVVGGNFKLSFYDKKHKLMAADVTRASARWPNPRAPGDNRTMLNGSGSSFVGAKPVVAPYNFTVYLTLLKGDGDAAKAVENYVVAFKG